MYSHPAMKQLLLAVLLLAAVSLRAQSPDPEYRRVLVPVFNFGGGAGGAAWFSSFDIYSTAGTFELARPVIKDTAACDFFSPCETRASVEEGKSETLCPQFEHPYGLLLWVPRSVDRREVHTYLRVRDTSRDAERAGTQIPVVWEEDLFSSTMMLLDVKTEPRYDHRQHRVAVAPARRGGVRGDRGDRHARDRVAAAVRTPLLRVRQHHEQRHARGHDRRAALIGFTSGRPGRPGTPA